MSTTIDIDQLRGRTPSVELAAASVPRRRTPPLRRLTVFADAVSMLLATVLAGGPMASALIAPIAVLVLAIDGHRADRIDPRALDDVPWVLGRLAPLGLLLAAFGVPSVVPTIALAAAFVPLGRAVTYAALRVVKRRGGVGEIALVLGEGEVAHELADTLRQRPGFGLRPIGPVDVDAVRRENGRPLAHRLSAIARRSGATRILLAFDRCDDAELIDAIRGFWQLPVRVHSVPRFFELGAVASCGVVDDLWGIPVTALGRPRILGPGRIAKRAFDVVVAGTALLVLWPVMAAVALAVRLTSPGPVLFRQRRIGRGLRPFEMLKFRTMRENDGADTAWHVHEDDRITPVGRFLRRTSLDELPQLWNVLRGDMSLVGPRPERPHYVAWFDRSVRGYAHRHRVDGGMTGWAQIHDRERELEAISRRARFDNAYIERWSFWGDLAIIVRTLRTLVSSKG